MFGVRHARRRADALRAALDRNERALRCGENKLRVALLAGLGRSLGSPLSLVLAFIAGAGWSASGYRVPSHGLRQLPAALAGIHALLGLPAAPTSMQED